MDLFGSGLGVEGMKFGAASGGGGVTRGTLRQLGCWSEEATTLARRCGGYPGGFWIGWRDRLRQPRRVPPSRRTVSEGAGAAGSRGSQQAAGFPTGQISTEMCLRACDATHYTGAGGTVGAER